MAGTKSFSMPTNDVYSSHKMTSFSLKKQLPYLLPIAAIAMVITISCMGWYGFTKFVRTKPTANESIYRLEQNAETSELIGAPVKVWLATHQEFESEAGYISLVTLHIKGDKAFGKVIVNATWENDSWMIKRAVLYSGDQEKEFFSST